MAKLSDKNYTCLKISFRIVNFLCFLVGIFYIFAGIMCADMNVTYFSLVLGILISVMGPLGWLLTARLKYQSLFRIYKSGTFIAFLGSLAFACVLICYIDKDTTVERLKMTEAMKGYRKSKDYQEYWKRTQEKYQCCGIDNSTDWKEFGGFNESHQISAPLSCLRKENQTKTDALPKALVAPYVYEEGCLKSKSKLRKTKAIFGSSLALAVSCLTKVAVILVTILFHQETHQLTKFAKSSRRNENEKETTMNRNEMKMCDFPI